MRLEARLVGSWQIHVSLLPPSFSPLPFFQPFLFFFPSLSLPSDPVTTVQVATRCCCLGVQAHDAERSRYWAQYSLHPPAEVCHPWSRSTILPDVLPGPYAAHIFCRDRYFTYCKCVRSPYCGPGNVFVKLLFKFSHYLLCAPKFSKGHVLLSLNVLQQWKFPNLQY